MPSTSPSTAPRIRSHLWPWGTFVLLLFVGAEVLCRLFFATIIGRSVLFYGTSFERAAVDSEEHSPLLRNLRHRRMSGAGSRNHSVRHTDNRLPTYSKYHPHQPRSTYDIDTGEVYSVTINGRGFRGPEVIDDKRPGVIRVVTLGASSTFGYHNRDDLTYPSQLADLLRSQCRGVEFEVINLGIPHLTSAQILALFLAEGVRLRPDVVTFYEGFNDANEIDNHDSTPGASLSKREPRSQGRVKTALRWSRDHVLLVALGDALVSRWTRRYTADEIRGHIETSRRAFLENLTSLAQLAEIEGFTLLIGSQQARSLLVPREEIRGMTFQQELDLVAADLRDQGWLDRKEMAFLTHGALMEAEAKWARDHGVHLVDVRDSLDSRRDTIVSWVHLSHEGNGIVAEQFAAPILDEICPGSSSAVAWHHSDPEEP